MKVYIDNYFDHPSSRAIDTYAKDRLRFHGFEADTYPSLAAIEGKISQNDLLISRGFISETFRQGCRYSFGGSRLSRPKSLQMLHQAGLETMEWHTCKNKEDIHELHKRWQNRLLILKRSNTCKTDGVSVVRPENTDTLEWDSVGDVFCKEVNPQDGTIYKIECFASEIVLTWKLNIPTIRQFEKDSSLDLTNAVREVDYRFPNEILEAARRFSKNATQLGLGYCSIDLMKSPEGRFLALEVNTQEVATWWSHQFPQMKENYAEALLKLTTQIKEESISGLIHHRSSSLLRKVKREVFGAKQLR